VQDAEADWKAAVLEHRNQPVVASKYQLWEAPLGRGTFERLTMSLVFFLKLARRYGNVTAARYCLGPCCEVVTAQCAGRNRERLASVRCE
jgi:hypothetical protein